VAACPTGCGGTDIEAEKDSVETPTDVGQKHAGLDEAQDMPSTEEPFRFSGVRWLPQNIALPQHHDNEVGAQLLSDAA
jgi:hypothetical protein